MKTPRALSLASGLDRIGLFLTVWVATTFRVEAEPNPFVFSAEWDSIPEPPVLRFRWEVPADHYLYADAIRIEPEPPVALEVWERTEAETRFDEIFQENREVYTQPLHVVCRVRGWDRRSPFTVRIGWMGCRGAVCFLPQEESWRFDAAGMAVRLEDEPSVPTQSDVGHDSNWREIRRAEGYRDAVDFLRFLEGAESGQTPFWARALSAGGLIALLVSLVGGILLNLTPCVLPLVPVILTILGAGHRARSRWEGFLRGLMYGLGMAAAYGILGMVVSQTGAFFGAWVASPWVNGAMALLFLGLALSLFGVFTLDFSRFQPRAVSGEKSERFPGWKWGAVFGMGSLSALLAGACVAPVVVAVLAHSASLASQQPVLALLLPLALGIGMGLPWPLAGAGLTILPKPGRWMIGVKILLGAAVFLLAIQYGVSAWRGARYARMASGREQAMALFEGLAKAERENRPVLLDFWATWCKSCLTMEQTTFRDERVRAALARYEVIKIQAERPTDPEIRGILERYSVTGLPTFVILERVPKTVVP